MSDWSSDVCSSDLCASVNSTPKNWARKRTVTPSNIAVPFWFAVAPMVRTKRATLRGSFNSVSATRSEVGSVAFDDAVENAITDASCVSRKKALGDRRASTMSKDGKTIHICTPSAARTTRSEEQQHEPHSLKR